MELAHRLISTRGGVLVLSGLAALLAGVLILVYVSQYRSSVNAGATKVTVLVANRSIPKGTSGAVIATNGLYTTSTIVRSRLLDGAYSDPSDLSGQVAARDIYPGAQLTASDFGPASSNLAASLTAHQRVVSIPLDSAHGLLDKLQVGDHVDVYAGFSVIPLDARGVPISGGQSRPVLRLIVPNAPVVAIASKKGALGNGGSSNVDLKVNDTQAAELAFAVDNGKLWLTLRPSSGAAAAAPTIVTIETLLLGVPPVTALRSFGGHQ
jgi:Flp pilus assembly protein CpaB